ncbi:hypothetical protein SLA2020_038050 [Shorea laevis]
MGQLNYLFLGFLILTSVSISICNGNSSVACIESEKEALLKFKQGILDHTNRMATWISDVDCCRWTGIVCDNMTSHVIELHLRSSTFDYYDADEKSKLGGKISPSLLHLKHLNYLYLSNNDFGGIPIPEFFGSFGSLRYLNLSYAKFGGEVPHHLGNLSNLKYLNLHGQISSAIGKMNFAFNLDFSSNSFQGKIPIRLMGNLCRLSSICFSHVNLSLEISNVLEVFSRCVSYTLESLSLHNCQLHGHLTNKLGNFKNLRKLDLSDNSISGNLPESFGQLVNVEYVDISNNFLEGTLSEVHFFNLTKLSTLYAYGNPLILDVDPSWIPPFQSHHLCLGYWHLGPQFPHWLSSQTHLRSLDISHCGISRKIPSSIGTLQSLRSLHLRRNNFSREIPVSIRNCTALEILDFGENELDGNISSWLGYSLPNLKILSLHSNKFSGHIPKELCALNFLQILDLGHNNLSGSLPRCISNLSAMVYSTNDSFGNNIKYKFGYFIENAFLVMKGRILEYDMTLNLVRILDFSNNSLSGDIPWEIASLHELQSLNLSHNLLIGRIPSNIGDMISLESLDFSANKLLGSIPQSMSRLSFLSCLNLSDNQLTGAIPSSTQLQSFDASSYAGNQLCGLPLADNCSEINHVVPCTRNRKGKDMDGLEMSWLFVSMALGFSVGFWSVLSSLVISRRWRYAYYQYLDKMWWKVSHLCV